MRGVKFGKSVSSNTEGEVEILLLEFAFGVRGVLHLKTRFLIYSTKSTFLCIIHNKNCALLKAVFVTENDVFHHCVYLTLWAMKYKLFETGSISSISQTSIIIVKTMRNTLLEKQQKTQSRFGLVKTMVL